MLTALFPGSLCWRAAITAGNREIPQRKAYLFDLGLHCVEAVCAYSKL
jgi:hypothetical protein